MFVTKKEDPQREDRMLRKSVEHGIISADIYGQCRHCDFVNNLTKNKSIFCSECGSMIRDRFRRKPDKDTSVIAY